MPTSQIERFAAKYPNKKEKSVSAEERAFLDLALERFKLAQEAESKSRSDSLDDWEFSIGNQWAADIQSQRAVDSKPCLTMDRIGPALKFITNEQRQQRPGGQVNPVGNGADVETAEVLQGMIRHTEVISDAEIAYDTAFDHMVRGGFGYWQIVAEYIDDKSFNQELKIKQIRNPFSVVFDPFCVEADKSDADFAFKFEDMPESTYRRDYPDSKVASMVDFTPIGSIYPNWATKETIRIADYYHVEYEEHSLDLLDNGSTAWDGQILPGTNSKVVKSRKVQQRKVIWSKINAVEELKRTEWLGKYIPIIPVYGVDLEVSGKRYLAGMVRGAKDPQRMYNFWISAITQAIGTSPAPPWLVAEGQIEGYETIWDQSNTRTMAVLPYKQVDAGGKPAPPPSRIAVEPPIQAMVLALRQADNDLKQSTLIFDPSLGDNPKDQSGKAISLLQRQGQVGNVNWTDNLSRSVRHSTRALIDLYPYYYDVPRVQRIINPDGSVAHVGVYNSQKMPAGVDPRQMLEQQGVKKIFDLGVGTYDVVVSAGPSYQTKRQEAVATQLDLAKVFPPLMAAAGDLVIRNMDIPQAEEIADRIKKTLPPQLQDDDDPNATLQKTQAQLAQITQQHGQLTGALQQANQIIETKKVESDTKIQLALIDERVKIAVAEINASKDRDKARGEQLYQELQMAHDAAHDVAMQATQQSHEQQMAQVAAAQQPTNGGEVATQ